MGLVKDLMYVVKGMFSLVIFSALIALSIYGMIHFSIWANYHSYIIKGGLVLFFTVLFAYMIVVCFDKNLTFEEKMEKLGSKSHKK